VHKANDKKHRYIKMKISVRTGSCLWAGIFTLMFLLSQDFWFSRDNQLQLGPWNYPLRIYYFVSLQFLLAVLLAAFLARRSGHKNNDSDRGH